jgi:putative transposase
MIRSTCFSMCAFDSQRFLRLMTYVILSRIMTYYVRNLPHWHPPGRDVFITWRLYGSPQYCPAKSPSPTESAGAHFLHYDRVLDSAKSGPLWLKDVRIAECVTTILQELHSAGITQVRAYTVMANHVHVLLEPMIPMAQITKLVKGRTAREANRILNLTGNRFWQHESYDHWVRDEAELLRIRTYIERNPVVAGLAANPQDWPWSSASRPIK